MAVNPFKELLYKRNSNARKLMNVLGCAYSTAWKKVNDPTLLTVKDLLSIEACGIASADESLEAIRRSTNGKRKRMA